MLAASEGAFGGRGGKTLEVLAASEGCAFCRSTAGAAVHDHHEEDLDIHPPAGMSSILDLKSFRTDRPKTRASPCT